MSKTKKRRPDGRAIRETKTYTIEEAAAAANKSVATIYEWLDQGLPTIDSARPTMIYGHVLKQWLSHRWEGRKRATALGELHCCGCQASRRPIPSSLRIERRASGAINAKALCSICKTRMNRGIKAAELAAFQDAVQAQQVQIVGFDDSCTTSSNLEFSSDSAAQTDESAGRGKTKPCQAAFLPSNPRNERLKEAFFKYRQHSNGRAAKSIRKDEIALIRFESHFRFRDLGPLTKDEAITFKENLKGSDLTMPVVKASLQRSSSSTSGCVRGQAVAAPSQ